MEKEKKYHLIQETQQNFSKTLEGWEEKGFVMCSNITTAFCADRLYNTVLMKKELSTEQPNPQTFKEAAEREAERRYPYEGGGVMPKIKTMSDRSRFIETAQWAYNQLTGRE